MRVGVSPSLLSRWRWRAVARRSTRTRTCRSTRTRTPGERFDEVEAVTGIYGVDTGGRGGVHLFVCPACPGMPYAHRYDR